MEEGLSKQALYSNEDYKAWRKEARAFQKEMKTILSSVGNPGYIKSIQAKNINRYLNVDKRQLFKAKNLSKAIAGIDMTVLYKQAMAFGKNLGRANGLVIAASLYGNAKDVVDTCNVNGWFEEKCNRSIVNNTVAGGTNVLVGVLIGYAIALTPATGGLSIALTASSAFAWGMVGGDISEDVENAVEEWIFE